MDAGPGHIFRIDRFVVPAGTRAEFISLVGSIHAVIAKQPGCVQNRILATGENGGVFKVVTFVEWDSCESLGRAKSALAAHHQAGGFAAQRYLSLIGAQLERDEFIPVSELAPE